jgi:DNA-binding NarL/FixJ family response regulator
MNVVNGGSPDAVGLNKFGLRSVSERRLTEARSRTDTLLVLIDGRTLDRECFVRCIQSSRPDVRVAGYRCVADWHTAKSAEPDAAAILFNIGSRSVSDPAVAPELARLVDEAGSIPVIILAESEDLREVLCAVDRGARGYIPASIGVDAIVEATRLTSHGGMFIPRASVLSIREGLSPKREMDCAVEAGFTARQTAVAKALLRGKANKIIAYELGMSESTVKVHIRNIMKKLKATNRTEAAFKLNSLIGSDFH